MLKLPKSPFELSENAIWPSQIDEPVQVDKQSKRIDVCNKLEWSLLETNLSVTRHETLRYSSNFIYAEDAVSHMMFIPCVAAYTHAKNHTINVNLAKRVA